MRHSVMTPWADAPLKRFVDEARVQLAVLMQTSGQVLAQVGFKRSIDVQTACALSAAINASAEHLGRMVEGTPFRGLHYSGRERQIFIAQVSLREGMLVLLVVFDHESSLGEIQLYLGDLRSSLAAAAPAPEAERPALAEDFENDLNRNLASLFGKGA